MKDFLGNELTEGDKVVFIYGKYNEFYRGTIKHILPKTVRVIFPDKRSEVVIGAQQVIKVDNEI